MFGRLAGFSFWAGRRVLLTAECKPFAVKRVHEDLELGPFVAGDAVIAGILAESHVVDWPLATHGAEEPVILQGVESPEIEVVPFSRLGRFDGVFRRLEPRLVRELSGEFLKPVVEVFLSGALQAAAEDASEFFVSAPTNSSFTSETLPAHHSTAATRLRPSGVPSSWRPVSAV